MGKNEQNLEGRGDLEAGNPEDSRLFCARCSIGLSRVSEQLSFRCVFVLVLSLCVLLPGIFWIFPVRTWKTGFDAKDEIKNIATIQAYFRLQKPVSKVIPHIERLEYDIYEEIGVPNSKVAILSMHHSNASNWTDVVFGVLPDPRNVPINSIFQSLLKSSLLELFFQKSNLTLTTTTFGQPYEFEILKFPRGITVIPEQFDSIGQVPQILFNFTLNNSISEIEEKFLELKNQLRYGLRLRPYENIFLQITNKKGSTISSPVVVQASILSYMGIISPQRLKQLAQIITNSPAENLGLDNSVFGHVKGVSLSSYMKGKPPSSAPTPAPGPSPGPSIPPNRAFAPAPSPHRHHGHHSRHHAPNPNSSPHHSMAPKANIDPNCPYTHPKKPHRYSQRSPASVPRSALPPSPTGSYGSPSSKGPVFPPLAPSPLPQSTSSSSLQ